MLVLILARHGIPPALERSQHASSWRHLLSHYKDQILACDFFTRAGYPRRQPQFCPDSGGFVVTMVQPT
jgi:hypothetical protein